MRSVLALGALAACAACSAGSSPLDSGPAPDATTVVASDAGFPEATDSGGSAPDAAPPDAGLWPDAEPWPDALPRPDATLFDTGVTVQTCTATRAFTVLFAPMYSAFDGTHTFQIPAIVDGINFSALAWSSSDPTMVGIQADSTTGGVLLTVLHAGTTTITAAASFLCGSSVLTVTAAHASDWEIGNARYNNGVSVHYSSPGPGRPPQPIVDDGGVGPACTNCHGPTATNSTYRTVSHTPEQAGGFSDEQLRMIITQGTVPDGGYFDPTIVSYRQWQAFHRWTDIQDDQLLGIIVYLRSLTPTAQNGSANFGGRRDGGQMGPGDGGGMGRIDSGN